MYYVDTSAIIALHLREANSALVTEWFSERPRDQFISDWTKVEIASALSSQSAIGPSDL